MAELNLRQIKLIISRRWQWAICKQIDTDTAMTQFATGQEHISSWNTGKTNQSAGQANIH